MQGPIVSLPLEGYLLISEGEVIIGSNVVDDALEALYRGILGHMGFI